MRSLLLIGGLVLLALRTPQAQGWPPHNGSILPATCAVGEAFFLTTATTTILHSCTATNTWTVHDPTATGGGASWGTVTGTLANQTDLQTALDAKSATSHTHPGVYEPANANLQAHVVSAHAPADAQKNSDITKAEIEAKLTGAITSHTHAGGGGGPTLLRVTGDVSQSTQVFADITGLTIAVTSGVTYTFQCELTYTTAIATTAIHLFDQWPDDHGVGLCGAHWHHRGRHPPIGAGRSRYVHQCGDGGCRRPVAGAHRWGRSFRVRTGPWRYAIAPRLRRAPSRSNAGVFALCSRAAQVSAFGV